MQQSICAHSCGDVHVSQRCLRTSTAALAVFCALPVCRLEHLHASLLGRSSFRTAHCTSRERQKGVGSPQAPGLTAAGTLLSTARSTHTPLAPRTRNARQHRCEHYSFDSCKGAAHTSDRLSIALHVELSWLLQRADCKDDHASAAVPRRGSSVNSAARAQNTNNDKSHDSPGRAHRRRRRRFETSF